MFRYHWLVRGNVQGVGFRYDTYLFANEHHLTGWVRNNPDGSVELEVQGELDTINFFKTELENDTYFEIDNIETKRIETLEDERGFRIVG